MRLIPEGIEPLAALALVAASLATSALTAAVGIGGGLLMLVAMALVVPVAALIPVHGLVQLGSNAGRAMVLARSAQWRLVVPFAIAALFGALAGGLMVTELPERLLLGLVGTFVLVTTWVKLPAFGRGGRGSLAAGGFLATLLTMFVGATGPFVIALFRQTAMSHKSLIATTSAAMVVQHGLKIAAFAAVGFAYGPWLPLAAAMIASGFAGTLIGARLLDTLPEASLRTALKMLLTAVALFILVRASGLV